MPSIIQRVAAGTALVVLSPLMLVLGIAVRMTSRGPALHRSRRISRGRPFTLVKIRTMSAAASDVGPGVTMRGDPRVTKFGAWLRRTKLDELPQLWNVIRGDMLLVGPRPEDPQFVDWTNPTHALVFGATPGITGPTAIAYRDEESRLAHEALAIAIEHGRQVAMPDDLERAYRERVLPAKLALDVEYLRTRSTKGDIAIIWATFGLVLGGRRG